jgi:hypothetical protein
VKLLRLSCRSSAYGLRRVRALRVFYSSFSSQTTVLCKSQCMKMIVLKLKGEDVFSYTIHAESDALSSCCPLPFPPSLPSFSDVAEAQLFCVHCMNHAGADLIRKRKVSKINPLSLLILQTVKNKCDLRFSMRRKEVGVGLLGCDAM